MTESSDLTSWFLPRPPRLLRNEAIFARFDGALDEMQFGRDLARVAARLGPLGRAAPDCRTLHVDGRARASDTARAALSECWAELDPERGAAVRARLVRG